MDKREFNKIIRAGRVPLVLLLAIWSVHLANITWDLNLHQYGMYPKEVKGLLGIITSPFIHDPVNFEHITNNSLPTFVLTWALFYFYREIAYKVLLLIWLMGGAWVWVFAAKEGIPHIGISGEIYGLSAFLFFSGVIRGNKNLLAISMLVTFLYGSMVWGIFPYKEHMSWESHLWGAIAGVIFAFYYREQGPQKKKYLWELEEELEAELEERRRQQESSPIRIIYHVKTDSSDQQAQPDNNKKGD